MVFDLFLESVFLKGQFCLLFLEFKELLIFGMLCLLDLSFQLCHPLLEIFSLSIHYVLVLDQFLVPFVA